MAELDDRVETAAQLIHKQLHRMGTGQVCDRCRELAVRIAQLLQTDRDS